MSTAIYDANIQKGKQIHADLTRRIDYGERMIRDREQAGAPVEHLKTRVMRLRSRREVVGLILRVVGEKP